MSLCVLEVKLGVNKGQVPNFSAPLWRGLFEICKDLNPCPGIRVVYGMSLGVFAPLTKAIIIMMCIFTRIGLYMTHRTL